MGVDLGVLFTKETCTYNDFKNRVIAIDAYNVLHQFLSIIRSRDGTPLKDAQGHITSHLSGLLYRSANLIEANIRPVYVFDGKAHPLKERVITQRTQRRQQAEQDWKEALEKGDIETAKKKAQQTSRVTEDIVNQSKELLTTLGIPYIQAPSEGESQASYMVQKGDAYAVGSQDFDCLLFGASRLIRNLTSSARRKLPNKNAYVKVSPEMIKLKPGLSSMNITQKQLIDIAILVGTDFNEGVKGYGPKKSLDMIRKTGNVENALALIGGNNIPTKQEIKEIRDIFLHPQVTDSYELHWSPPDIPAVLELLCDRYHFNQQRIEQVLQKFKPIEHMMKQKNLFDF
ncbi:MAG: flap endonuclease-1 [Thermoplasmatota archaeon]